jgi:spore coat polysaccharide biosynthesis protein SpsF
MNTVAIVQIRQGSSRLPGKALIPLNGISVAKQLVNRIQKAKLVDSICFAIPAEKIEMRLVDYCTKELPDVFVYLGSVNDVLLRVAEAAFTTTADYIVDITGDCPLIDPREIDFLIEKAHKLGEQGHFVYTSNINPRILPDGFDIQVYNNNILQEIEYLVEEPLHRVHSGWNIMHYASLFPSMLTYYKNTYPTEYFHPDWGLTLDTEEDYKLLNIIFKHFQNEVKKDNFTMKDIIKFILDNPVLLEINKKIKRKTPGIDG